MATNTHLFTRNISSLPSGLTTSFSDAVSGSAVTITLTQPEGHTLVLESLNCTSDSATAYVSVTYGSTVVFKNTVGTTPINWHKWCIAPANPPLSYSHLVQ